MATGKREDPLRGFNFTISLLESSSGLGNQVTTIALSNVADRQVAGFSECSGLEGTLEVEDHKEGGNNGAVLKFPTRITWSELTLKRGITTSTELWEWFDGFVQGRGERKDGLITLHDENHQPHTVWGFRRGLPTKFTGPALNASQNEVAIETVQIVHEGLYQLPGASGLASAVGEVASAIGSATRSVVRSLR